MDRESIENINNDLQNKDKEELLNIIRHQSEVIYCLCEVNTYQSKIIYLQNKDKEKLLNIIRHQSEVIHCLGEANTYQSKIIYLQNKEIEESNIKVNKLIKEIDIITDNLSEKGV